MIGRDRVVRGAVLSVMTNGSKLRISRPLTKLVPLEITNKREEQAEIDLESSKSHRSAFLKGQLVRRLNMT